MDITDVARRLGFLIDDYSDLGDEWKNSLVEELEELEELLSTLDNIGHRGNCPHCLANAKSEQDRRNQMRLTLLIFEASVLFMRGLTISVDTTSASALLKKDIPALIGGAKSLCEQAGGSYEGLRRAAKRDYGDEQNAIISYINTVLGGEYISDPSDN